MSTTQDRQIESPNVDEDLAEQMATYVASADGEVVYGTIREVTERDGSIAITVSIPGLDEAFRQDFERPKPPFGEYPFTRLARVYGTGLGDLYSLDGTEVPCRHTEDDGWMIDVPEPDRTLRQRLFSLKAPYPYDGIDDFFFEFILWPAISIVNLFTSPRSWSDERANGARRGILGAWFWIVIGVLLLVLLF